MKAAVLYGKEDVRIESAPEAPLRPGEVRVQVRAALTCGTDLKVYKRGYHAKMIVPPAVFGHELAGVICETHPETSGWQTGERVVAANSAPCGACYYCRKGQENLCDDLLEPRADEVKAQVEARELGAVKLSPFPQSTGAGP